MTPCEEKGYKVGDLFRVLDGASTFSAGSVVALYEDDGSVAPLFELIRGYTKHGNADGVLGAFLDLKKAIKITPDWENAPEGTTHFDPEELPEDDNRWMRYDDVEVELYTWGGPSNGWMLFTSDAYDMTIHLRKYILHPAYEKSIPKGVITAENLRDLALNSGLQVEFHTGGGIYVWDDTMEVGARLDNIDEYIELAEAKIAYLKIRCKYVWE